MLVSEGLVFSRVLCSFFALLCPFRVAGVGHPGHFEVLNLVFCDRCRTSGIHPRGRRDTFGTLLERWQAWVKMRGAFGGHFSWQEQYLVNLDDVLKGSKVSSVKVLSFLLT